MRAENQVRTRPSTASLAQHIARCVDSNIRQTGLTHGLRVKGRPLRFAEWRRRNLAQTNLLLDGLLFCASNGIKRGAHRSLGSQGSHIARLRHPERRGLQQQQKAQQPARAE
jgi:hypothetical protein